MDKKEINQRFAKELITWSKTGKLPESANQDVRYSLKLQQERLAQRNLRMEYELAPPKDEKDITMGGMYGRASRKSTKYESYIDFRNCTKTIRFLRDGKKRFEKKSQEVLYVTTTWLKEGRVYETENYCCPSCGAINTIKVLQEGCAYCHTKFMMSDLFPKVTSFLYASDYAAHETVKKSASAFALAGAAVGVLVSCFSMKEETFLLGVLYILGSAVGFAFIGYVVWAFGMVGKLLLAAIGSVSPLVKQQAAKNKITTLLSGFDTSFSWDYFTNQLVSTLKTIIFSNDRRNLAVYEGNDPHPEFDEIVEASFQGKISMNYYRMNGNYCYLNLDIHMLDVHDKGRKIYQKEDVFRLGIVKDITKKEEVGFSVQKVQCKNCGGSFDAMNERHCPYCGQPYDIKEDEWVVADIRKF